MEETIPGTRAIAQRMVNAANGFIENTMDLGFTRDEAHKILEVYRREKIVKLDAVGGVYRYSHGAFVDADVMRRALLI